MASELPSLEGQTLVEASWVWWGSRILDFDKIGFNRAPFRAPHHTVSEGGLIGSVVKRVHPGEASLAHGGCLFLDELGEFRKSSVESLGRVLKAGISRLGDCAMPAKPALLVASSNVCPCGWFGTTRPCLCNPDQVARWNERILAYCDMLGVQEIVPVQYRSVAADFADRSGAFSPKEMLDGLKETLEAVRRP
jgi:magnesium chelatase family protein